MAVSQTYRGNGHEATIADPSNITRDECLALALCGAEAWNAWRGAFPGDSIRRTNFASFDGVDFSRRSIVFSHFKFGNVDFNNAIFGLNQIFLNCDFLNASFDGAQFNWYANFDGTRFGAVSLRAARFQRLASFTAARFEGSSNFEDCLFSGGASFAGALLSGDGRFDRARFQDLAVFTGAMFGPNMWFESCVFEKAALFDGRSWVALRHVFSNWPKEGVAEAVEAFAAKRNVTPSKFSKISFNGASFHGRASFCGREFHGRASFDELCAPMDSLSGLREEEDVRPASVRRRPVIFSEPPQFFDCEFSQQVSFDAAVFPWPTGDTTAARAYRTLKLAFSKQQATREEQRFFKLEMAEEVKAMEVLDDPRRWLYRAYEFTSDYGFSVWRPIATLILLPALVAMLLYLLCMGLNHPKLMTSALVDDSRLTSAWLQFTFANMAPLPDSGVLRGLRETMFGSNTYAAAIALKLETLQKVLALIGYFLFGLALRNLFKMK